MLFEFIGRDAFRKGMKDYLTVRKVSATNFGLNLSV